MGGGERHSARTCLDTAADADRSAVAESCLSVTVRPLVRGGPEAVPRA
jgi:hypothetical protein